MGKGKPAARTPKSTPFKTNGFAPSYTPKPGDTNSKQNLQQIQKNLGGKK